MKRSIKSRAVLLLVVAVCFAGAYALKNSAGINLFEDFSLSNHFPFRYLRSDDTLYPEPFSLILNESFNVAPLLFRTWSTRVQRREGEDAPHYEALGVNGSRCMVIRSDTDSWWNISHRYLVSVKQGDVLRVTAQVWNGSDSGRAGLEVAAYDANRNIIKWNYWSARAGTRSRFETTTLQFTIPAEVSFIRLRLAGGGRGEFRFDDIRVELIDDAAAPAS
ncbi:MAG: hypothetical protein IPJ33_00215 [Gammaproteobacteria bacterium]|jgi:hypothetical protein|nr:hypothetical protein [Gammaproteobacteria bacterium]MBP6053711.1 hypothetical protein [Pseudomonadales bacterium]MBK6581475.1 hypothetical protein [Gammaproteobacteria bacterium]MBK7518575.1 hypothetical protein [Gammaproteobacteria bacterium]MBK7726970.1 hypothetical protein [Gammaproteobacteria bacterium]